MARKKRKHYDEYDDSFDEDEWEEESSEEYDEESEDDDADADEYDDESEEESESGYSGVTKRKRPGARSVPARSVGIRENSGRKKRIPPSSLVRVTPKKPRPIPARSKNRKYVTDHEETPPSRHYDPPHDSRRHGPHFFSGFARKADSKNSRDGEKRNVRFDAAHQSGTADAAARKKYGMSAWSKLLFLIVALTCGTWYALHVSSIELSGNEPGHKSAKESGDNLGDNASNSQPVQLPDKKNGIVFTPVTKSVQVVVSKNKKNNMIPDRVPGSQEQVPKLNETDALPTPHSYQSTSFQSPAESGKPQEKKSSAELLARLAKIAPMISLPGGTFRMGNDMGPMRDQRPAHQVTVSPFRLDQYQVTNRQFQLFVDATRYKTAAEEQGWSYVFDFDRQGWVRMSGAYWHNPDGKQQWDDSLLDHPVAHVSWVDATAFCKWAGKRLPTEAEWEYAARGGLVDMVYPWGDQRLKDHKYMSNDWQGWYPQKNTKADGFLLTSPVGSFPANPFGLYDMAGNVWEWCSDWYSAKYYQFSAGENPHGPEKPDANCGRVVRGGSFLSAENRDAGYRVDTRSHQPEKAGYQDLGFRCAAGL